MNPSQVTFSQAQIRAILDQHNSWRHNTAAGSLTGFQGESLPSATRMAKMQWSDSLAESAALNTKQCAMSHDSCRGSSEFNFAGQNLAIRWASNINIDESIQLFTDMWGNEREFVRVSDILSLQGVTGGDGQAIGHYTAMVNEKMTHVGCAMSLFEDGTWRVALFACNYAFNNFLGRRVYQHGAAASQCITGRDSVFGNLCTINEPIDVNDWNRFSVMSVLEN